MDHAFHLVPIWNRKLLLIVGFEKEELLSLISLHKLGNEIRRSIIVHEPTNGMYGCVYFSDRNGACLIYFPHKKVRTDTIIHETNHITRHMLKSLGAVGGREPHAYLQEYLYHWIKQQLKTM